MSNEANKQLLGHSLSILLGLDVQDVSDVIDHLLTFDSPADLHEYLSALLGDDVSESETVQVFVENIGRFQRGETLLSDGYSGVSGGESASLGTSNFNPKDDTTVGASSQSQQQQPSSSSSSFLPRDVNKKKTNSMQQNQSFQSTKKSTSVSKGRAAKQNARQGRAAKKSQQPTTIKKQSLNAKQQSSNNNVNGGNTTSESTSVSTNDNKSERQVSSSLQPSSTTPLTNNTTETTKDTKVSQETTKPAKPALPQWGKAKINCGCYGTKYKALTNCLNCGRIICEREGYGYCPFCGYLVEDILTTTLSLSNNSTNRSNLNQAVLHKERLLKFDREGAQRTKVLDDQVDYYRNSTSTWLNEEEQAEAEELEESRRRDLHERKKPVLNIQF